MCVVCVHLLVYIGVCVGAYARHAGRSNCRRSPPYSRPLHPLATPQLPESPDASGVHAVYAPGGGGGAATDYGRSVLLTDIEGMEDHLGDMDFKVKFPL